MSHRPLELFYSYSHKDEELRDDLEEHLAMLKRDGVIAGWHDRRISGGREWEGQIDKHLNSADIILLLTSSAFLASDYCYDIEVRRAMERHEQEEARVIPVILRACDWHTAPFGKLQALPKDGKPVKQWPDPDVAFLDIANGIRRVAEEMNATITVLEEMGSESSKPDPHLLIPDLRLSFVSRKDNNGKEIVKILQDELSSQRPKLVALWGAGGVGKTAIASEAVRGLFEPFARRIAWVSADGLESFSLATLLDEIATQLGRADLRKLPSEQKKEQVRELVRSAPTLVVLDNFETIEETERIRCVDWLGKPAPCSGLITTRDVIEAARNIPIEVMRPEEANALLDQLIDQAHDARAFTKLDRDRLIQTAEANPLVLQWIVGQIDLAQDPDEVLDDLQHGEGKAADRVFNRSYELKQLNNGGRAVLLALSLFAPSATRKAVAEVSGLGKAGDRKKFKDSVRSLSALWLIRTADDGHRLVVEGLTRELTKARLDVDPRGKTFRPRFVSRYSRFSQTHGRATREDYNALESEKDNLLSAMDVALSLGDRESIFAIAYPLEDMLDVRGYWDDEARMIRQALNVARSSQAEKEIWSWSHNLAVLRQNLGEIEQAEQLYDESLEIAKKIGDDESVSITLHQLGTLAEDQGKDEEAMRLYSQSLEFSRKLGNQNGIANTLHQLGNQAAKRGEFTEAKRLYEESLDINQKLDDQRGIAVCFHQLASLAQDQDEFKEARRLYDLSLDISKHLGHRSGIARTLYALGTLASDHDNLEQARTLYKESLEIEKTLGNQSRSAIILDSLAELAQNQGQTDEACRLYTQSLEIEKRLGNQSRITTLLDSLAELAHDQGKLEESRRLHNESLEIAKELNDKTSEAVTLHQLGMLDFTENEYIEAERHLQDSLTILRQEGDEINCAECLQSIGNLRMAQTRLEDARALLDESLEIAERLENPFRIASVTYSLGLLAEKQDDTQRARYLIREAVRMFEDLDSALVTDAKRDLERINT